MTATAAAARCADCRQPRVRRQGLLEGDPGIHQTAALMAELIRDARRDPLVREHAEAAVAGVHPRDPLGEVLAVRDYLADRVEYRQDPRDNEWLQHPRHVLCCQVERGRVPQLDCDDLTTLSLAMLESLGHETRLRIVSQRPDQVYNHVYGVLEAGGQPVKLDLVQLWRPPRAPAPPETRAFEVPV